jgi:hypothetical protein
LQALSANRWRKIMTPDECSRQLRKIWNDGLKKHGAIDMIAGSEFVGYVIQEDDGFSIDVWSWGVNHGKVFRGNNIDDIIEKCYDLYDKR